MKRKIRTLVVEDFGMMRLIISNMLVRNEEIDVVGTARNGKEGLEKALLRKPDVIVTDMLMPEYDGMYLVKEVMKAMPTPIILISALEKDSPQIFDALEAGAFDFVDKPGSELSRKAADDYLVKVIMEASKVDPAVLGGSKRTDSPVKRVFEEKLNFDIIVIGASTGGPKAIETLLEKFPDNLPVPVIIGQKMPHHHLVSFTERLNNLTPLPVKLAENHETVQSNHIYVAPGNANLFIEKSAPNKEPVMIFKDKHSSETEGTSLDLLLGSASEIYGERVIGVLLSGMGGDGAKGMAGIYKAGGTTIAQDEKSALAFGMPQKAIESGYVKEVLSLNRIADFILSSL